MNDPYAVHRLIDQILEGHFEGLRTEYEVGDTLKKVFDTKLLERDSRSAFWGYLHQLALAEFKKPAVTLKEGRSLHPNIFGIALRAYFGYNEQPERMVTYLLAKVDPEDPVAVQRSADFLNELNLRLPSNVSLVLLNRIDEDLNLYGRKAKTESYNPQFMSAVTQLQKNIKEIRYRRLEESIHTPPEKTAAAVTESHGYADATESIKPHKWDVFVCHATEDKEEIARPLAEALRARGLRVWYDEFSLTVGDSLRKSIDEGLGSSRFGIVILSGSFFEKHWPQQELNGLATREVDGKKVILPVWHRIGLEIVRQHSPMLADRVAVRTDKGLATVVETLIVALH